MLLLILFQGYDFDEGKIERCTERTQSTKEEIWCFDCPFPYDS